MQNNILYETYDFILQHIQFSAYSHNFQTNNNFRLFYALYNTYVFYNIYVTYGVFYVVPWSFFKPARLLTHCVSGRTQFDNVVTT